MGAISERDSARLALSEEDRSTHSDSIVIDLHVDSILLHRLFRYDVTAEHDPRERWHWRSFKYDLLRASARLLGRHQPYFNHADVPRMLRGGYNAAALGIHAWPGPSERAWAEIQRQLGYFDEVIARNPRVLQARDPSDVRRAARAGRLALFPAVEGFHALGAAGEATRRERLDRIEVLHERHGVRYITLAHLGGNDAARNGFGIGSNQDDGLTTFGREVVRKMNEVGMMIDVSHLNHRSVMDVCGLTTKPVLASHTGFAGARSPGSRRYLGRLLRDEAILAIARTGGVLGVMFVPYFLAARRDGLRCVTRHLRYACELLDKGGFGGVTHLAIGSDFDGWVSSIPNDLDDAADMPRVTVALREAGFSHDDVRLIWGENVLRVWQAQRPNPTG